MKLLILALVLSSAMAEDPAPVAPAVPVAPEVVPTPTPAPVAASVVPSGTEATAGTPIVVPTPEKVAEPLPEVKVPETDAAALKDVQESFGLFQVGEYGAFAAVIVGLLIFAYNKFAKKKSS